MLTRSFLALAAGTCLIVPCLAADAPPATLPAPEPPVVHQKSIFDFGLEPIGNGDADKADPDTPAPDKTPAAKASASEEPAKPAKPAPDKPVKPAKAPPKPAAPKTAAKPATTQTAAPSVAAAGDVSELARFSHVSPEGVITVDQPVTFALKGTEGKSFTLTGDLYPAAEPTKWGNGAVYFYLRQINGTHRYELSIKGMRAKRILLEGRTIKRFAFPMSFPALSREHWHTFSIDAAPDHITASFDDNTGTAKGPVETRGTNVIILQPGAKLRNLKLTIHEPTPATTPK